MRPSSWTMTPRADAAERSAELASMSRGVYEALFDLVESGSKPPADGRPERRHPHSEHVRAGHRAGWRKGTLAKWPRPPR